MCIRDRVAIVRMRSEILRSLSKNLASHILSHAVTTVSYTPLSIVSDRRITVRASFVIQKRTEDIEFELENVVLQGLQTQQYAISYDGGYQASSGCLILKLFGIYNSVLSGYIAPKGEDGERSDWFKHGRCV